MLNLLIFCSVVILTVNCQREHLLNDLRRRASDISSILPDNANETTQFKFGLHIINIIDFDYERREIELRVWLELQWTEKRLRWNKKDYGGIDSVRLNSDFIPRPDLKLYTGDMNIDDDVLLILHSDGSILYMPPAHLKALCNEKQHRIFCGFKFGSWTYDCHQLQLKSDQKSASLSEFQMGWRWNLINATTKVDVSHYSCCPEPYCSLNLYLEVEDKAKRDSWWS